MEENPEVGKKGKSKSGKEGWQEQEREVHCCEDLQIWWDGNL